MSDPHKISLSNNEDTAWRIERLARALRFIAEHHMSALPYLTGLHDHKGTLRAQVLPTACVWTFRGPRLAGFVRDAVQKAWESVDESDVLFNTTVLNSDGPIEWSEW